MEERKIADAIRQDNNRKDYCLRLLEKMVYGAAGSCLVNWTWCG